jgi:hypothetical protein
VPILWLRQLIFKRTRRELYVRRLLLILMIGIVLSQPWFEVQDLGYDSVADNQLRPLGISMLPFLSFINALLFGAIIDSCLV